MPADAAKLGINFAHLKNPSSSDGIGGSANEFQEVTVLSFVDSNYVYSYILQQGSISEPSPHNARFPSLLGRDILHRWRFVMDKTKDQVLFTPLEWDFRRKL